MHAFLTVRRLKSGSYDDWRKAWEPEEWPEGSTRAYILRNVDDPDEVIAFGFYDLDLAQARQEPRLQEQQRARFERMAPYVESTGADGVYEGRHRSSAPEERDPEDLRLGLAGARDRLHLPHRRRLGRRPRLPGGGRPRPRHGGRVVRRRREP